MVCHKLIKLAEYEYDEVYGRSLEEEVAVSPNTAGRFYLVLTCVFKDNSAAELFKLYSRINSWNSYKYVSEAVNTRSKLQSVDVIRKNVLNLQRTELLH